MESKIEIPCRDCLTIATCKTAVWNLIENMGDGNLDLISVHDVDDLLRLRCDLYQSYIGIVTWPKNLGYHKKLRDHLNACMEEIFRGRLSFKHFTLRDRRGN